MDQLPIPTAFPAGSRTTTVPILTIPTTATSVLFADKILITISQHGKLGHWIHVPLTPSPTADIPSLNAPSSENALLPSPEMTATTILGGTLPLLDTLGQTLATSLASAIHAQNPLEGRMLVLGLGLDKKMERVGGEGFAALVGVALDVL